MLADEADALLNESLDESGLETDESDTTRFELILFRAKCHFDARNVEKARACAQLAAGLQPANADVQNLLAVLNAPGFGSY